MKFFIYNTKMIKIKKYLLFTIMIMLFAATIVYAGDYRYINKLIINENYQEAINAIIVEAKKNGYNSELKKLTAKIEQLIELDKEVYKPVEIYGKEYMEWRKNRTLFHKKSMVVGAMLGAFILSKIKDYTTYDPNLVQPSTERNQKQEEKKTDKLEKSTSCRIYIDAPWAPDPLVGYIEGDDIYVDVSWGIDKKIGYFKNNDIYVAVPWSWDKKVGYIEDGKVYADIPWAFDRVVGYVDGGKIYVDTIGFDKIVGRIEGSCTLRGAGAFFLIAGYFQYRQKK